MHPTCLGFLKGKVVCWACRQLMRDPGVPATARGLTWAKAHSTRYAEARAVVEAVERSLLEEGAVEDPDDIDADRAEDDATAASAAPTHAATASAGGKPRISDSPPPPLEEDPAAAAAAEEHAGKPPADVDTSGVGARPPTAGVVDETQVVCDTEMEAETEKPDDDGAEFLRTVIPETELVTDEDVLKGLE